MGDERKGQVEKQEVGWGREGGGKRRYSPHTLFLSSALVSSAQERYQLSLFISLASLSYLSRVRLSTWPVR